jgi:hypothetical protein
LTTACILEIIVNKKRDNEHKPKLYSIEFHESRHEKRSNIARHEDENRDEERIQKLRFMCNSGAKGMNFRMYTKPHDKTVIIQDKLPDEYDD